MGGQLLAIDRVRHISSYDYYVFYLRQSRIAGLVWLVLSLTLTIGLLLVFIAPNWIGDSLDSPDRGYFGLYTFCRRTRLGNNYQCLGTWTDLDTLPNSTAAKLALVLVGIALLISILCLLVAFLAIFVKIERVFHICAWIQLVCSNCLLIFFEHQTT